MTNTIKNIPENMRVYAHDMRDELITIESITLVCFYKDITQPTKDIHIKCEPYTTLSDAIDEAYSKSMELYAEDAEISSIDVWTDSIWETAFTERGYSEIFEGSDLDFLRDDAQEEEENRREQESYTDDYKERMAEYRAMVGI